MLTAFSEAQRRPSSIQTLLKLDIPKFSGEKSKWVTFRDLFLSSVHNNQDLSNAQRFQYLRSYVTGDAESLIRTIPITEDNYQLAWENLMDAFNKPSLVVSSIFERFLGCQTVSPNHCNLRTTFNLFRETFETLERQGEYAQSQDALAVHLMVKKLDQNLTLAWAKHSKNKDEPSTQFFLDFLKEQCGIYDHTHPEDNNSSKAHSNKPRDKLTSDNHRKPHLHVNSITTYSCFFCKGNHSIYKCPNFLHLSHVDRQKYISEQSRCSNCLSKGHSLKNCSSVKNCFKCNQRHNSLLHIDSNQGSKTVAANPGSSSSSDSHRPMPASTSSESSSETVLQINSSLTDSSCILPTALVDLTTSDGSQFQTRVLIDTGSQATFISESIVKELGLKRHQSRVPISCMVNQKLIYSKGKVDLTIRSRLHDGKKFCTTAHVLPQFIGALPQRQCLFKGIQLIKNRFHLADPTFDVPSDVNLILGASFLFEILKPSQFYHTGDKLYIQDTHLGYIICNKQDSCSNLSLNHLTTAPCDNSDNNLLQRFWELEEVPKFEPPCPPEAQECDLIFQSTTSRLPTGRFCVRLPFRQNHPPLGSSSQLAHRRFLHLERKLNHNPDLRSAYLKFMAEYESLGHMQKTTLTLDSLTHNHYVIPHHGIWQKGPSGMKLRAVFDASAKTSTGTSLNSILHTGPRLQSDITHIINRFRKHLYVMTADIEKMYRQINVHPDDQQYQLILWRTDSQLPVEIFKLSTVTYGESCSPYLALRTLQELVKLEGTQFPAAAEVLQHGRYVDDIFFGRDDLEELRSLQKEIIEVLSRGCFFLKKWATNHQTLLAHEPASNLANPLLFSDDSNQSLKTLGIVWYPILDSFSYRFSAEDLDHWTKRSLLADSAKLFDPLGWIAPVILKFKALFQQTWVRHIEWDSTLPSDILQDWKSIRNQLPQLSSFHLPRFLGTGTLELHGFSDASQLAYAAVVYARTIAPDGSVTVQLLMAKTKLAPIRQLSIPRLELCGAQLLTQLVAHIRRDFSPEIPIFLWTDSTTVLAWIKSMPRKWTSFVGNRIGLIHELCPGIPWYHVKSAENPADVASRGLSPLDILSNNLWLKGPTFLSNPKLFPPSGLIFDTDEEAAPVRLNVTTTPPNFWISLMERFSQFSRLLHVVCYVLRFRDILKSRSRNLSVQLEPGEISKSLQFLISRVQNHYFSDEISRLSSSRPLSTSSSIRTLDPFLDKCHLLRVGGRLRNADSVDFNSTPILLPKSRFSDLVISKTHLDTLHGGSKICCSQIRLKFWIIGLSKSVKRLITSCVRCTRYRAKTYEPPMGQLPSFRVQPSKPFSTTGVDFAGPFMLRPYQGRGKISVKGYIALFVCCSTKAVHLELVMGLSVSCLLMGLRRFIARRGRCHTLLSDHGRNFIGCNNVIKEFLSQIITHSESPEIRSFLTDSVMKWEFIPPYSPHFGGIWESGIKSVKYHLYRMFNGDLLTIEEIQTALCQIESILNSRPLTPLSFSEPLQPITPSHLLTGEPTSYFPDVLPISETPPDRNSRQEVIRNLVRGFWKKWRNQYLDTLMRKPKWTRPSQNPNVGDLVIIKRNFDPPRFWSLGKVVKLFPGPDKVIRAVEVRTRKGNHRESTRNLIPLHVDADASTGGSMADDNGQGEIK